MLKTREQPRTWGGSSEGRAGGRKPDRGRPAGRPPGEASRATGRGAPTRPERVNPVRGARVLLIEDEAAIRTLCRVNLNLEGIETLEAENGTDGVEIARRERPDLILLDVMLPEMDGWVVAEQLRTDDATRELPIVFLSARSDQTDRRRGYELGGVGYVTKPFDPASLAGIVEETLLRMARGEREQLRRERFTDIRPDSA